MKVLIIEDDQTLAQNLKQVLQKDGFAIDIAVSKENGLIEIEVNEYDCLILDIPTGSSTPHDSVSW